MRSVRLPQCTDLFLIGNIDYRLCTAAAREGHGIACDPALRYVIVFGGQSGEAGLNGTCEPSDDSLGIYRALSRRPC